MSYLRNTWYVAAWNEDIEPGKFLARVKAALIPDYAFLEATPVTARCRGYLPTDANYQLVVDNIMDLSHVDYLHAGTLGGGAISRTKISVNELNDGRLHVKWMSPNEVPPPVFGAHLPDPTPRRMFGRRCSGPRQAICCCIPGHLPWGVPWKRGLILTICTW